MSTETATTEISSSNESARLIARSRYEVPRSVEDELAADERFCSVSRIMHDLRDEQARAGDVDTRRHFADAIEQVGHVLDAALVRVCVSTGHDVEDVLGGRR